MKVIRAIFSKLFNCPVNPIQSQIYENGTFLRMLLAFLIFTQKNKKQFNYKGLDFIYWKKYINVDCLPSGTACNKVGFENLYSKHNQKVTECEV